MEFYSDSFHRFVRSVVQNEALFSEEKMIDMENSSLLPLLSPASLESVFALEENKTPVNQKSNANESMSLKKEKMLENGQIKIFTQAIDSCYNSAFDQDPCSLPTSTSNTMFSAAYNQLNDPNLTTANNIQVSSSSKTKYLMPSEHRFTIREERASSHQRNCQKNKIWNSNVGKKILAVYFSPMSIKSEFLSNETMMDGFESFALQEAVFALHEIVRMKKANGEEDLNEIRANLYADPLPVELVRSCEKSRAFKKLSLNDKIILLKNAFLDLNAMKNVTTYDATIDGWHFGNKICTRKQLYTRNPILFKKAVNIMDSFPVRFKSDFNVIALLFLIIIFNSDLPKLKFKNTIKSEQYVFIYLLRKYLISCVESTCDAMDYFIHMMTTVEEIQVLKRATEQDFESCRTDGAQWLKNKVVSLIEIESIRG